MIYDAREKKYLESGYLEERATPERKKKVGSSRPFKRTRKKVVTLFRAAVFLLGNSIQKNYQFRSLCLLVIHKTVLFTRWEHLSKLLLLLWLSLHSLAGCAYSRSLKYNSKKKWRPHPSFLRPFLSFSSSPSFFQHVINRKTSYTPSLYISSFFFSSMILHVWLLP